MLQVSGLMQLDAALCAVPIAHMALFSSISSVVAPAGQANYAAANAQLNHWANARSMQVRGQDPALGSIYTHVTFPSPHVLMPLGQAYDGHWPRRCQLYAHCILLPSPS